MPTAPKSHRPAHAALRQKRVDYRPSASERGYDHDWHKVAEYVRKRDSYLCQECLRRGIIKPTKTVDHIKPVWKFPELRLDPANCECLCVPCNVRKGREDMRKYGPHWNDRPAAINRSMAIHE